MERRQSQAIHRLLCRAGDETRLTGFCAGRRPIAAFGNSDGDLQILQWTTAGSGARFALLVHHTDDKREWAYDRKSHIGKLDKALDEAATRDWTAVDMKDDWKTIFPPSTDKTSGAR